MENFLPRFSVSMRVYTSVRDDDESYCRVQVSSSLKNEAKKKKKETNRNLDGSIIMKVYSSRRTRELFLLTEVF